MGERSGLYGAVSTRGVRESRAPEQSTVPGVLRVEMEVMQFEPGVSGNPNGRPRGTSGGRVQALAALDVMLAKKKNQRALVKALEDELLGNPVRFFKTIIMPLLPREARLSLENEGVIAWRSLLAESEAPAKLQGGTTDCADITDTE